MALPPDRFQLVSMLGSSRLKGAPIVAEIAGTGMPLAQVGSAGEAVRVAGQLATQLFLDDEQLAKISPELIAQLEVMQRNAKLNVIVLGSSNASRGTLRLATVPSAGTPDEILAAVVPKMLMHQRGTPRADVTLSARFESGARDEAIEGRVSSLSEGGVLFVAQTPPSLGETGMLSVVDDTGEWEVRATVVNERKMERGAGMKFESLTDSAREHIRHIVALSLGGGQRRDVKQRVLSLDPSVLSSKLTEAIFSAAGYEVQICTTPAEAAKALAAGKPDLFLIDHSAATLAGDRTKEIVRRAQGASVVFYSNADEAAIKQAQQLCGVQHHIYKGTFADSMITRTKPLFPAA